MAENEVFKTEFKGYKKTEVTNYINSLNEQMQQLQNELDACESELEKYKSENTDSEVSADQLEADIKEQLEQKLRTEIEQQLKQKITEQVREQLEKEYKSDISKLSEYEQKAQKYDDSRQALAELMIKAKSDAEAIIQDANSRSAMLINTAVQRYDELVEDFALLKGNIVQSKNEMLIKISNIQRVLDEFEQQLNSIEEDLQNNSKKFRAE